VSKCIGTISISLYAVFPKLPDNHDRTHSQSSELKGKTDPNGTKCLSENKVEIINHFEKLDITYFLVWYKKLWSMRQVDPLNIKTDDEKKNYFNSEFPKYDYTLYEIIGSVEKKFDKTSDVFKSIGARLNTVQKKVAQEEMLTSLRMNYLGRQNKRILQDLETFIQPVSGSSSHITENLHAIFAVDYLRETKTSTESFHPDLLNAPWDIPSVKLWSTILDLMTCTPGCEWNGH
jgi:hypothetical protein